MNLRTLLLALALPAASLIGSNPLSAEDAAVPARWPEEKAAAWQKQHGWLRGCNFIPSNAINQLEMWQAATFDPATLDRELGWAAGLGFNSMRVYLHDLPYQQDPKAFLGRIDKFMGMLVIQHF